MSNVQCPMDMEVDKEVIIAKEVKRSNGSWRFACADVFVFCLYIKSKFPMVLCSTVFTEVLLYCLYFCLCIGFYSPLRCTVSGGAAHHRLSAPHSFNITSNSFTTCLNATVGRKILINVKLWYHQHYQKSVNSTQTHQHHPSYIPWTL